MILPDIAYEYSKVVHQDFLAEAEAQRLYQQVKRQRVSPVEWLGNLLVAIGERLNAQAQPHQSIIPVFSKKA